MKDPLSYLVNYLLQQHKIHIDKDELSFQIQSHPTYPSLHAVTSVLHHFGIENLAVEVEAKREVIDQLPESFLAQVEENGTKSFAIVIKQNNNYKLVFGQKNSRIISLKEFLEKFTGILLAVDNEDTELNTTPTAIIGGKKIQNIIRLLAVSFLVAVVAFFNPTLPNTLFFVLSLLGIYISYIIIKQEEGESTLLGNAFCALPTEKRNCNAVLKSKGATLYNGLKVSHLSFMYFVGLSASMLAIVISGNTIAPILLLSIVALPITVYSIYYQLAVVKTWCFLCLGIVGILWAQATTAFLNIKAINPSVESVLLLGLSLSVSIVFALSYLKSLKSSKQLDDIKIRFTKFKRNFELFESQLTKAPVIETNIASNKEMTFGNINAPLQLTIVTNPLCGHCKPVHRLIEKILKQYSESVTISVRFNVSLEDTTSNKGLQIALRLLELYDKKDEKSCLEAMHDAYLNLTPDQWLNTWSFCSEKEIYTVELQKQNAWCNTHGITFTPEILINGKSYPRIYDREDLIYFIEDLEEQEISNSSLKQQQKVLEV